MENNELNEIKEIIEQNAEINQDIQTRLKKIENYLKWQKIGTIFNILIIVAPIVLGIIFLPPLFREVLKSYQELLGTGQQIPINYELLGL